MVPMLGLGDFAITGEVQLQEIDPRLLLPIKIACLAVGLAPAGDSSPSRVGDFQGRNADAKIAGRQGYGAQRVKAE